MKPSYRIPVILVSGAILLLLIVAGSTAVRVDAGEACVIRTNGKISGDADPGFHFRIPGIQRYTCYSTRAQLLEFTDTGSRANYQDTAITAKTQDGVNVTVTGMVRFNVPSENLPTIYTTVGPSMDHVNDRLVQVVSREQTRNVIEQTLVANLYLGGMEATSLTIAERLAPEMEERGVVLESFNLTTVDPGEQYRNAVQEQQLQREEAKKQQELVAVEEQKAEQKRVQAEGDANAGVIRAQGEAEENRVLGATIQEYPEILQLEYYKALSEVDWAIFSPGDVQPVMEIPSMNATPEAGE